MMLDMVVSCFNPPYPSLSPFSSPSSLFYPIFYQHFLIKTLLRRTGGLSYHLLSGPWRQFPGTSRWLDPSTKKYAEQFIRNLISSCPNIVDFWLTNTNQRERKYSVHVFLSSCLELFQLCLLLRGKFSGNNVANDWLLIWMIMAMIKRLIFQFNHREWLEARRASSCRRRSPGASWRGWATCTARASSTATSRTSCRPSTAVRVGNMMTMAGIMRCWWRW